MARRMIHAAILMALLISGVMIASAQGDPQPLRVNAAVTGKLTSAAPTALYSFNAAESLRMAVTFDLIESDMAITLIVPNAYK